MSAFIWALASSLLHAVWIGGAAWGLRYAAAPRLHEVTQRYAATVIALFGTAAGWLVALAMSWPAGSGGGVGARWPLAVVAAWALGVSLLGIRLVGGLWWWDRAVRKSAPAHTWQARFDALAATAGVLGTRLRVSVRVLVPCTVGFFRPVVLLPAPALAALDDRTLEAVLLHELAHVTRNDWLAGLAQACVEVALFHVPFVTWLARQLEHERELCADERAGAWLGSREDVARALVNLEAARQSPTWVPAARGGSVIDRVHHLLRPRTERRSPSLAAVGAGLLALSLSGGLAWAFGPDAALASWMPPDVARWEATLLEAGERHGVDPDLLAAMTLVESAGDPHARSPMGATGLMQVMPATAKRIAEVRGLDLDADDLSDPTVNIDLAAWYLAKQLEDFGEVELAVAAYNAGPNAVRAHLDGAPLAAETVGYKRTVLGLWADRDASGSDVLASWWDGWRARVSPTAPVAEGKVVLGFGGDRDHHGMDIAAPRGTPVASAMPGTVVFAEEDGRNGLSVWVRHRLGLQTRYHHLDGASVAVGDRVAAGAPIGTVGSSGVDAPPHLHVEVRSFGAPVDPTGWW